MYIYIYLYIIYINIYVSLFSWDFILPPTIIHYLWVILASSSYLSINSNWETWLPQSTIHSLSCSFPVFITHTHTPDIYIYQMHISVSKSTCGPHKLVFNHSTMFICHCFALNLTDSTHFQSFPKTVSIPPSLFVKLFHAVLI